MKKYAVNAYDMHDFGNIFTDLQKFTSEKMV